MKVAVLEECSGRRGGCKKPHACHFYCSAHYRGCTRGRREDRQPASSGIPHHPLAFALLLIPG
eukprot:2192692-Rhodomonas_salina.1